MPRKEWVPKNKYCKKSKLSEREFEILVMSYFLELLYNIPRDSVRDIFGSVCYESCKESSYVCKGGGCKYLNQRDTKRTHVLTPENKLRLGKADAWASEEIYTITTKSIGNYFNRIGQYIWDEIIVDRHPLYREKDIFDDLLFLIHQKKDKIESFKELYFEELNKFPLYLTEDKVTSTLMYYLLSRRSKAIRGFKKESFKLEFSRVFFICSAAEAHKIKLPSLSSITNAGNISKVLYFSQSGLLSFFKEKPL